MQSAFRKEYWSFSKQTETGLLFVAPLWLLYEVLAYWLNSGWSGSIRTGADFLFKSGFEQLGLSPGLSVILPVVVVSTYVVFNLGRFRRFSKKPTLFAYMLVESLGYAIAFGVLVGGATGFFLSQDVHTLSRGRLSDLVVNIGSGAYEELIFRLVMISAFAALLKKFIFENQYASYGIAIVISSLLFSLFHYLDFFGEPLQLGSFTFRFLAGISFSLLLIFRGYGITAYTHSLYNVLLMFR